MTLRQASPWALSAAALLLLVGCPEDDSGRHDADATADTGTLTDADATEETVAGPDGLAEVEAGPPPFVHATAEAPADPLGDGDPESCPVFQQERCGPESGTAQVCDIYDPGAGAFVAAPDGLLRRVYLYDRWYDLYGSPDGQTAERAYSADMAPDAPEEVWSDPSTFAHWAGAGDSAIWTGAALTADAFRYLSTGTEADYRRMEDKVRALVLKFDVTGIPGYLARYHFLMVPDGTPPNQEHVIWPESSYAPTNRDSVIESPETIPGLPAAYFDGVPDGQGGTVKGVPWWHGHPSIDQYTGPMVAFPVVWPLLRDQALKDRIVEHLTCYLKRLRRLEIVNLHDNPDVVDALTTFLAGNAPLQLDEGDIDLLATRRLVLYYHHGINDSNRDTFDRSCPDTVALEPLEGDLLDAADPLFLLNMAARVDDFDDSGGKVSPGQMDHVYVPNMRGGDASHMIHLAAMAYWFTGDEQYETFLFDELIGELEADRVALTMQAFREADFCFKFFGDHITYGTHWQLLTMLGDSPLRDAMARAMEEEMWQKALHDHKSAKFNVMYAATVPAGLATARELAIAQAVEQLRVFGGWGTQDAPRRTENVDPQEIMDRWPAGTTLRCPTEEERVRCEDGGDLFGIPLESRDITFECEGRANECPMADGTCAEGLASTGLPADLRAYADFMWQRSPYTIGQRHTGDGRHQSPGRDLSEPYWMARYYGYITEGAGQVLAWRDSGVACQL